MGMKEMAAKILRGGEAQKLRPFSVYGFWFNPTDFSSLAYFIEDYEIPAIKYSKTMKEGEAYYNPTENKLVLGFFKTPAELSTRALVVHEATHAVCDIKKMPLSIVNAEVRAWIVRCQYVRANSPKNSKRLGGFTAASDKCFDVAWWLAGMILDCFQPKTTELDHLRSALIANPNYGSKALAAADYQGV